MCCARDQSSACKDKTVQHAALAISKKPAALPGFDGAVDPYIYEIEDGRTPTFEGFPEWLRDVIEGAPEFAKASASVNAQQDAEADQPLFDAEVA